MKITKFAQCCLLIEMEGKRILTDPGRFSTAQNELTNLDLILITHEHADHFHAESLQAILDKNPGVPVVTNTAVGKILTELGIEYTILEGRATDTVAEIDIAAYDGPHAEIYKEVGLVQNTGYFIGTELFYPGDAYTEPDKTVPVLALPVAGPWCRTADAIAYAKRVAPKTAFPVHDYLLNEAGMTLTHSIVGNQLQELGIEFVTLTNGETKQI